MPKFDENPELDGDTVLPPASVPVAHNVALKLPIFWLGAGEAWFAQWDTQFAIKAISVSKTKFYYAVTSLPQDVGVQILDLIHAPSPGNPYKVLKDCLIPLYSLNDYKRFEALVSKTF